MGNENSHHDRGEKYKLENQMTMHPNPDFVDGYWVLPMDAFPSIKRTLYLMRIPPFQLTAKYLVCFLKSDPNEFLQDEGDRVNCDHIPGRRCVNPKHPVFSGNDVNFVAYKRIIHSVVF